MGAFSGPELAAAAVIADVEVPHIVAVAAVESAARGPFDDSGHPTVLFERHKFSAYTNGRFNASHPQLSDPHPGGYGLYSEQVRRLRDARALDDAAAVMSTSWGAFQLMGFNFKLAGFSDCAEFETAMRSSAGAQLMAFARFLVATGCARLLSNGDWRGFARRYNGPAYEKNSYHEKIRRVYEAALESS